MIRTYHSGVWNSLGLAIAFNCRYLKSCFFFFLRARSIVWWIERIDKCVRICHQCKTIFAFAFFSEPIAYNLITTYREYNICIYIHNMSQKKNISLDHQERPETSLPENWIFCEKETNFTNSTSVLDLCYKLFNLIHLYRELYQAL